MTTELLEVLARIADQLERIADMLNDCAGYDDLGDGILLGRLRVAS